MHFQHSPQIWHEFPELACGVLFADAITDDASVDASVARFSAIAQSRLAAAPEGQFPEVLAWRRAFARMGLKPTQYRCAAESLLRRFRKEHALPRLHPLVDLCNAISIAFATPVAVFDVARIADHMEVRHATGDEVYLTFSGQTEHPEAAEVVFADGAGRAHARRWTNRQSGYSAVQSTTDTVLIVAEAMHETAATDMANLAATIADELRAAWSPQVRIGTLTQHEPAFAF